MGRPVKVLHVLHAFSHGGLENGIVNIINNSPEWLQHELCLVSQSGEFAERLKRGVVIHELHKCSGNDRGVYGKLYRLFKERTPTIIHTRNWGAFDGVVVACGTPGAVVLHGEHGRDFADPEGLNRRRNLIRRLMAFRIRRFVAVSKDLQRWLHDRVGVPANKIIYIPNGVDANRFSPGREDGLRRELGIRTEEFVVGAVGRLDPVKNHGGLIRAMGMIGRERTGTRLAVIGDGPDRRALEQCAEEAQVEPRPLFLGYRADIERCYRLFDVLVLNSFGEGMSNTLLEGMSTGLPVVCTAVGGNPDLVADGVRGTLVRAGDDSTLGRVILKYALSRELRECHGTAGREYVLAQHSLAAMTQTYVDLYRSCAE